MLEVICLGHEHQKADREKPPDSHKPTEEAICKGVMCMSGGGLFHHPDICLDGSRFALRAAHQKEGTELSAYLACEVEQC